MSLMSVRWNLKPTMLALTALLRSFRLTLSLNLPFASFFLGFRATGQERMVVVSTFQTAGSQAWGRRRRQYCAPSGTSCGRVGSAARTIPQATNTKQTGAV